MGLAKNEKDMIDFIESKRQDLIDFVCELIKVPSPNPPGDERRIANLITKKMGEFGVNEEKLFFKKKERPNILYTIRGEKEGNKLLFNGHLDTKPVGNEGEWETNPFSPTIIDGNIYGLGSSDMKGAIGALIFSFAAVIKYGNIRKGELQLLLTADEEAGSSFGAGYLSKEGFLNADVALIAEPSGIYKPWEYIYLSNRATLGFKTKIFGTQMHSSLSDQIPSINVSEKMANVILKMIHDMKLKAAKHDYYPGGLTYNIGVKISGGDFYGIYPGYVEFLSDIRLSPGITSEDAYSQVRSFVNKLSEEDPNLKIEVEQEIPRIGEIVRATEVSPDNQYVKVLQKTCINILGFVPPNGGFPGGTDALFIQNYCNIPTIPAFGPGILSLCHQPNEYVPIEAVVQAAKIYALSAVRYLSQ